MAYVSVCLLSLPQPLTLHSIALPNLLSPTLPSNPLSTSLYILLHTFQNHLPLTVSPSLRPTFLFFPLSPSYLCFSLSPLTFHPLLSLSTSVSLLPTLLFSFLSPLTFPPLSHLHFCFSPFFFHSILLLLHISLQALSFSSPLMV